MICVANVAMSGWPLGDRREVDVKNEKIIGLLRGGYIVPLVMPRSKPAEAVVLPDVVLSPGSDAEAPEKPKAASKRRKAADA